MAGTAISIQATPMSRVLTLLLAGLALMPLATGPADAAPKKRAPARAVARKPVVKTPPKPVAVGLIPGPVGYMTPKAVVMRTMTPAEAQAHAIWNVRAALNVAALQCQYSRFLDTRNTYNALLTHHAEELQQAQRTVQSHFTRLDKGRGQASFDRYNTQTYNSFSTLDAQYRFCEAAGEVGKRELAQPKGRMGVLAVEGLTQLRAALAWQPLAPALAIKPLDFADLPKFDTLPVETAGQ